MKRLMSVVACFAACSLGMSSAFAGPGCSGAAKTAEKGSCATKTACCKAGEFPRMVRMVGDKTVDCPMTAEKMAKDSNAKIVFAVAGEKFDSEAAAWNALANESEMFVRKFTTVSFEKDGKTYYVCDEGAKACASKSAAASGCCKSGEVKMASAKGSCCKSGEAKMASGTCSKTGEAKTASAKGCCKSGEAKMAKAEVGKKCSSACAKGDDKACCMAKSADAKGSCSKGANVAVIDTKTCEAMCKDMKDVKFMVAGQNYTSWDDALKAQNELRAATSKIRMAYVVNGQKVDCSSKVCPKAREAGQVKYVVADKEMPCELMARVELARAQYEAAKKVDTKTIATKM